MILEMVAFKALHTVGNDIWRCMICPDQKKYTRKQIHTHLVDFHQLDDGRLSFDKAGGEIFKECFDDTDDLDVFVELEEDDEFDREVPKA
jgi:hypothetical protein